MLPTCTVLLYAQRGSDRTLIAIEEICPFSPLPSHIKTVFPETHLVSEQSKLQYASQFAEGKIKNHAFWTWRTAVLYGGGLSLT